MEENKQYISSVKLPNDDSAYYLKDLELRQLMSELFIYKDGEYILDSGTAQEYITTQE